MSNDRLLATALERCRPPILWIAAFSLLINILMLTSSLYMMQVFDRVLASGSLATLAFLTLAAGGALALMAGLDFIRSRVLSGGPILDLVPRDDRLVIEARVRPTDIDVVHVGLPARVIFNAFKMRTTPQLEGTVALVSADAMTDERTGVPYYTARIVVDAKELDKLGKRQLQPGMPAETMIVTGERTMLEYLLQPINETFRTAFREE